MDFIAKPSFRPGQNQLLFASDKMNYLLDTNYNDKFGFYQANFGVYSYMTLTSELTYVLNSLEASPFMWQPHNSCNWNPVGVIQNNQTEIQPCRAKINAEQCYDALFDSAFAAFNQWAQNPTVEMSDAGVEYINKLTNSILAGATYGARVTLTAGQLYAPGGITFDGSVGADVQSAFNSTIGTCKGWLELVKEQAAAGKDWMNDTSLIPGGDLSADGETYTGDPIALYDAILANAKPELVSAVNEGGIPGFNVDSYPLMLVSTSIYNGIVAEWRTQAVAAAQNFPRISRMEMEVNTARGTRKIFVMKIDETVVVPLSELGFVDKHVAGATHVAYLTVSGNINLGASFANLPVAAEQDVAVAVERVTALKEYGKYRFASHSLFGTAISDTNYIAGVQVFAEP